ncbi:MAG TPA: hypothetical protein VFH88_00450, partial [Candidatus Krumholzibacteria bacterium]|nr:hypothetical protein [Candidatus Krumholzibacteria bacterium]
MHSRFRRFGALLALLIFGCSNDNSTAPGSPTPTGCADYATTMKALIGYTPPWTHWLSSAFDLALMQDYAVVADGQYGLEILSVANPSQPVHIGHVDLGDWADDVAVSGNYAYVANSTQGLAVVDVSNPYSPTVVGTAHFPGAAYRVAVSGPRAFVAAGDGGLKAIDISNPASPTVTGSTTGSEQNMVDVALAGDYAVVANSYYGVAMVDISGPTPGVVATLSVPSFVNRVAADGNYAYVAAGAETHVIDITDPLHPALVAGVAARRGARYVTVHDGRLYVSDIAAGVQVVDVSTPADPHELGYLDVPPLPDTR